MKKLQYILYGIILLSCFSCEKEDSLQPNAPLPNLFDVAEGATTPTSELRRKFHEETGCYLLFTDTLKHEYIGTDVYGNPLYNTELIDLSYGITSAADWVFSFTYLSDYEKQKEAVELVKTYILPVLNKNYYPYSFLLIDNFISYVYWREEGDSYGYWSADAEQDFYFGPRTLAISISLLQKEPEEFAKKMVKSTVQKYLTGDKLQEFYAPGMEYYAKGFFYGYEYGFYSEEDFIRETGILSYYYDDWDESFSVDGMTDDLEVYLTAILEGSEEDFKAEYDSYPLVIKRYNMLKQLLIEGGFSF